MSAPRVLLADTDADLLHSYQEQLIRREGFVVRTASTPLECAVRVRDFGPDVLVLDAELPSGRGTVLARLGEETDLEEVWVIVLSQGDVPGINPFPWAVHAWLVKPVPVDVLAKKIRELACHQNSNSL